MELPFLADMCGRQDVEGHGMGHGGSKVYQPCSITSQFFFLEKSSRWRNRSARGTMLARQNETLVEGITTEASCGDTAGVQLSGLAGIGRRKREG